MRSIGQLTFLTRKLPSIDYTLGRAASRARSAPHAPARPLSESARWGDIFPPPLCGRYPEGNTQVDHVIGRLVGGREADEDGERRRQQRRQRPRGCVGERGESAQSDAREAQSARRSAPGRTGAERGAQECVRVRLSALYVMYICVAVVRVRSFARAVRQRPAA